MTNRDEGVNRSVPDDGDKRKSPSRSKSRAGREAQDANRDEGLALSRSQREAFLRDEALNSKLPNPPRRPGWHYLWASQTNSYNPISWYKQIGYQVVKASELGGWVDSTRRGSGEYEGMVCINEMVLMKIDDEGYQHIMRVVHHDKPNEEGERLRQRVDAMVEGDVDSETGFADSRGKSLVHEEGDGLKNVARRRRAPTFQ